MSRPTLKLPAKSTPPSGEDDRQSFSRKPVRGGAKVPKQSAAQHAGRTAAKAARLAAEAEKPKRFEARTTPRVNPERVDVARPPTRASEAVPSETTRRDRDRETPSPREVRTPERPKAYPKRGIARSTGARALPPPRLENARTDDEFAPRPNADRREVAPRVAPPAILPSSPKPITTRQDAPTVAQSAEPEAVRRPLHEPPRLSKRISEMTQCSRREADEWIENGWVWVDGVVVTTLGTRVHPNARIEIREEAKRHQTETVTILLNKPLDAASEAADGDGESALPLIRPENRWAEDGSALAFKATHLRGLALAGKLDPEASGMLVFTQEGSVARRITGDETRLEKEYMVRVEGQLSADDLQRLNHGLALDEIKLKRAQVSWQNEQQLRFVLHESRKNQIRHMCELVGLRVVSIKRIRIGSVSLGKLPAGQWRYLRPNERF